MKTLTLFFVLLTPHAFCQSDSINLRNELGNKIGEWRYYSTDSVLMLSCFFNNDTINGEYIRYNEDGSIETLINYKNGVLNGKAETFWPNSQLLMSGNYVNGIADGVWIAYDSTGNLVQRVKYQMGLLDNSYDSMLTIQPDDSDHFFNKCDTITGYEYKNQTKEIFIYCNGILSSRYIYEKHKLVLEGIYVNGKECKRIIYRKHGKNRIKRLFYYENERFSYGELYNRKGVLKRKVSSPL